MHELSLENITNVFKTKHIADNKYQEDILAFNQLNAKIIKHVKNIINTSSFKILKNLEFYSYSIQAIIPNIFHQTISINYERYVGEGDYKSIIFDGDSDYDDLNEITNDTHNNEIVFNKYGDHYFITRIPMKYLELNLDEIIDIVKKHYNTLNQENIKQKEIAEKTKKEEQRIRELKLLKELKQKYEKNQC